MSLRCVRVVLVLSTKMSGLEARRPYRDSGLRAHSVNKGFGAWRAAPQPRPAVLTRHLDAVDLLLPCAVMAWWWTVAGSEVAGARSDKQAFRLPTVEFEALSRSDHPGFRREIGRAHV